MPYAVQAYQAYGGTQALSSSHLPEQHPFPVPAVFPQQPSLLYGSHHGMLQRSMVFLHF